MEKKKIRKSVRIGIAALIVLAVAGASAYAISDASYISEAEAKQVALREVQGSDSSNITKFRKDLDDGRAEYDIEIVYDGYEYDFEISAKDGTIFDRSKEWVDGVDDTKVYVDGEDVQGGGQTVIVTPSQSSDIGLKKAKSVALSQVPGASGTDIVKACQDYDDGRVEYDVEIHYNGYEYEFEIDGKSGRIIGKDVDRIDDDFDDNLDDIYED